MKLCHALGSVPLEPTGYIYIRYQHLSKGVIRTFKNVITEHGQKISAQQSVTPEYVVQYVVQYVVSGTVRG